ncbi:MAG: DUF3052 domain-containing protein [Frankia sp.]|nr:DUF3052 domain-containing protein [Frankia sp.]
MSATAGHAAGQPSVAQRLGIQPGSLVQQVGHGDDADDELIAAVTSLAGTELSPEDSDDVVDVVLLWWRDDDGDLVDALVDARTRLDASGSLWVLTPKSGRAGHVEPSDIIEAAPTAGLVQTSTLGVSRDWTGTRLVAPKSARAPRR